MLFLVRKGKVQSHEAFFFCRALFSVTLRSLPLFASLPLLHLRMSTSGEVNSCILVIYKQAKVKRSCIKVKKKWISLISLLCY